MKCIICGKPSRQCELENPTFGEKKFKCTVCTHTWLDVDEDVAKTFHDSAITWKYIYFDIRDQFHNKRLALIRKAGKWPPQSALDLGCGDGRFLELVEAERSVGVDCNKKIPGGQKFEYRQASIINISTKENYDLVTSFHSMEHVRDCVLLFKKMMKLSNHVVAIEVPSKRRLGHFTGHVHSFNDKSFREFIEMYAVGFKTVGWRRKIQGASIMWVGKRK